MCEEQHDIVEEGADLTVLSSVLRSSIGRGAVAFLCDGKGAKLARNVNVLPTDDHEKKSCEHHIRVVSNAMLRARTQSVFIHIYHRLGGIRAPVPQSVARPRSEYFTRVFKRAT